MTSPAYDCCPWPPSIQRPGLLGERPPPLRSLWWLHLCSPQRRPECSHLWQEQGGQLGLCTSIRQQPQGAWHLFRGALTSMLEMHKGTALIHWKSKQPTLPRLFTSFRKKEVYCRKVPAVLGRATRPPPLGSFHILVLRDGVQELCSPLPFPAQLSRDLPAFLRFMFKMRHLARLYHIFKSLL